MLEMNENFGLYTDFYELAMAEGYFYCNKKDQQVSFNYFFRTNPFGGGFTVFAGLADFLEMLSQFTYSASDIQYLKEQGFKPEFLEYLKDFRFSGNILSVKEGEIVFPNEPVLRVDGNIIECQLIESLLLNMLNFESLIATKAFRIKLVAGKQVFAEFGLRRAQGLAAIHASRAACIGGASSTSNVLAGKLFDIPVSGTMAHSWIQSFDTELEAFRSYSNVHPENTTLLVDTYDTLKSGVPNAIVVAKEMEENGYQLKAIRLDSGDLAYLSKKARKMLDDAGLKTVKIIASNQLNEHVIKTLLTDQFAAIDAFGIGTEMVTGKPDAALDGVYKLTEIEGMPKMKFSENIEKNTLPSKKQLYRFLDSNGKFYRDAIALESEIPSEIDVIYHPVYPELNTKVKGLSFEKLLTTVVEKGEILLEKQSTMDIYQFLKERAELLPEEHKRFISPHIYKTGITQQLMETRNNLSKQIKKMF
ncbi:Nicotinate phosphoribosyltransferase [sediment metagenome]|uniref:nicotinate phosphoribosyltransferase n=1 Tax=sediment metagenome TaxID=749907 RepID=D9PET7_9ZZZZ